MESIKRVISWSRLKGEKDILWPDVSIAEQRKRLETKPGMTVECEEIRRNIHDRCRL